MAFVKVPTETRSQIKRAGKILVQENPNPGELVWAIDLANRWRACHAYPINTFQATLRNKLRYYSKEVLVAQRLKRMPTIMDKLKRYPNMQLTTMQDIGGLRVVFPNPNELDRFVTIYKKSRFAHELIDEHNYIYQPRDEDGYRSHHLIYRYRNVRNSAYNGLRLEVQLRTKLQHTWATAVETMGTFLGQALKSRQGQKEWIDFFAIVSSAFAHQEKLPSVPRFSQLTEAETKRAVAQAERSLGAIQRMRGVSAAINYIGERSSAGEAWSYHLIVLNSLERMVEVRAYDRGSFTKAVEEYSAFEKQAAEGKKIEPVLVSAGPIAQLRKAYPNFFLDIKEFVNRVQNLVS